MLFVHAALVGRLGAAELAGVGLATIMFTFVGMLFNFLVVVTTPQIAAAVAQNDPRRVRLADPSAHRLTHLASCSLSPQLYWCWIFFD